MRNDTHETVPTQCVEAKGTRYAYRCFGKAGTIPLLLLAYFTSTMDGWDPAATNGLAADHEVLLFDNAGVGASGGETPHSVVEMTQHCVDFCGALDLREIDVVGFSLGGMIAQHLPNAQLIVYSDSSHGAQYQHAKLFLEHVKLFLS